MARDQFSTLNWSEEKKKIKEMSKDFLNDKEYVAKIKKTLDFLSNN